VTRAAKTLVVVLALALAACLVALGLLWQDLSERRELDQAGEQAERAARKAVTAMTTYDHRTLDEDFAWVEEAGTVRFQEFFAESSKQARAFIEEIRARATGEVVAAAADVEDAERVDVLLFVDQTITSRGEEGSRIDQPRVTMTMVREGEVWLVDEVQVNNLLTSQP